MVQKGSKHKDTVSSVLKKMFLDFLHCFLWHVFIVFSFDLSQENACPIVCFPATELKDVLKLCPHRLKSAALGRLKHIFF